MFLAIAAVVLTLPLLLAALMRNMALPGVLLVLVLIALASAVELPLLKSFHSDAGPGIMSFVAINAFTAATILTIAMVVRCNGLYLGRRRAGVDVG
jgi:hypothetical protein